MGLVFRHEDLLKIRSPSMRELFFLLIEHQAEIEKKDYLVAYSLQCWLVDGDPELEKFVDIPVLARFAGYFLASIEYLVTNIDSLTMIGAIRAFLRNKMGISFESKEA